jgi:hypothetical protein
MLNTVILTDLRNATPGVLHARPVYDRESKRQFGYPHAGTQTRGLLHQGHKEVLNARLRDLYQSLDLPIESGQAVTNYYASTYILNVTRRHYGNEFVKHREELYTALSFVFAPAEQSQSLCCAAVASTRRPGQHAAVSIRPTIGLSM